MPTAIESAILSAVLLTASAPAFAQGHPPAPSASSGTCRSRGELAFVCGVEDAEDLAILPGGGWVVASGMGRDKPHGAMHLIDVKTKAWRRWFPDAPLAAVPDLARYPDCAAPPDPKHFWAQGLSLQSTGPARGRLLVAGHAEREAIEIFDVDTAGPSPRFTWRGCLRMPPGLAANSVSVTPGGVVLASVLFLPGRTMADNVERRPTGGVYARAPGARAFELAPGSELPGDNGLEAMPDAEGFFVVAWGLKAIYRFDLTAPLATPAVVPLSFHPDNIHWNPRGELIAAGMVADEPACGGPFRAVAGKVDLSCHRGYAVAAIDPKTLAVTTVASGPADPDFSNVSTGLVVGDELWLGSFRADRLAYRKLKDPRP